MEFFRFRTSAGPIVMGAESQRPSALVIHGFRRSPTAFLPWRAMIPDLGFLYLPGHAGAPLLDETSVEAWACGFREVLEQFPKPMPVIGESLGATLAMAAPYRALIAIEPVLTTDRLWPLGPVLEQSRQDESMDPRLTDLFANSFEWVLPQISAPTLVLAGDDPLMPPRAIVRIPSVLSEDDFAAFAGHPAVEARRIPGGHALMEDNRDGVWAAAQPFMVRHGYLPT